MYGNAMIEMQERSKEDRGDPQEMMKTSLSCKCVTLKSQKSTASAPVHEYCERCECWSMAPLNKVYRRPAVNFGEASSGCASEYTELSY